MRFAWTNSQLKLLAEFCANVAVAWFAVAFIAPIDTLTSIKGVANMMVMIVIALKLMEVAKNES